VDAIKVASKLLKWIVPVVFMFGLGTVNGFTSHHPVNGSTQWESVERLHPGTRIRVVEMGLQVFEGNFVSANEEALVIRRGADEQIIRRERVMRVSARSPTRRTRSSLIGAAAGATTGLALGAIADRRQTCGPAPQPAFPGSVCFDKIISAKAIFVPTGAVAGALLGAVISRARWTEVYRQQPATDKQGGVAPSEVLRESPGTQR
jgi:hypothetical protein